MKFDLKQTQSSRVIQDARSQIKPTVQPKYKNTNSAFQGSSGEYMKNLMAKCRTVVGTPSNGGQSACPANRRPDFVGSKTEDWLPRHNMSPITYKYSDKSESASYAIYDTLMAVGNGLNEMFDNWFAGESMSDVWPIHKQFTLLDCEIDRYLDVVSFFRDKFFIKSLVALNADDVDPDSYCVDVLLWICFEDINEDINAMFEESTHHRSCEWYYGGRFISSPYDERGKIDSDLSKTEFDDYSMSEIAKCMNASTVDWLEEYVYDYVDNNKTADVSYDMYKDYAKSSAANKTKWLCLLKLLTLSYQINEYIKACQDGNPSKAPFSWGDCFLIEGRSLISIFRLKQNDEGQATAYVKKLIKTMYPVNDGFTQDKNDRFKDVF